MSKAIVFDIGSSFGYFRKGFTTTNALTHAVIPRSSVEGLVGAILGISISEYPEKLQSSQIAVEIQSHVRKINMKYMHINPDWWQNIGVYLRNESNSRTIQFAVPASVEFLVSPKYRIYFDNPSLHDDLKKRLIAKKIHYTPFLGTSSMISGVKHVGEFEYQKVSSTEYFPVSSIVPFSIMPKMNLERNSKFAIEDGLPIHIDNQRVLQGTYKVIYNPEPSTITIMDKGLMEFQIGNVKKYVKFLPTQITS